MRTILLTVGLLSSMATYAAAEGHYELRRITVGNNGQAEQYVARCHITPGTVVHRAELGDLKTERAISLTGSEDAIQALVDSVSGISRPELAYATGYTNWWVRSSPEAEFKLVRSNVRTADGNKIYQDESEAAQRLATFMGINCFRSFGE